jgi:hypothetical protein
VLEDSKVERPESMVVVEVSEVGELVAERVDQARVLEGLSGSSMTQADPDAPVGVTDPVTPSDVGALRLETAQPKPEQSSE